METSNVIARLRELSDPRAIEIWKRFGLETRDEYLGVQLTKLKQVAKEIKRDPERARELWESGIHDAKTLSALTDVPRKTTRERLEQQIGEVYGVDVCDKFATELVAKSPFAAECALAWVTSKETYVARCGWVLVWRSCKQKYQLSNEEYAELLSRIETEIESSHNWVREAMLMATMAIGQVDKSLKQQAIDMYQRVGPIEIDYGDTGCKQPDVLASLQRS